VTGGTLTINDFANSHFDNGDSLSGRVGSVVNNTNRTLVVFSGTNRTGSSLAILPHLSRDFEEANGYLDHNTRSAEIR
jgi:hypothetical protein